MTDEFVPAAPDPAMVSLAAGVIRHVLSGLGALGIGMGATISDSNLMMLAGAVVWLASTGWSLWQKYGQQTKLVAAAEASASKRKPVEPATNPPPP